MKKGTTKMKKEGNNEIKKERTNKRKHIIPKNNLGKT